MNVYKDWVLKKGENKLTLVMLNIYVNVDTAIDYYNEAEKVHINVAMVCILRTLTLSPLYWESKQPVFTSQ